MSSGSRLAPCSDVEKKADYGHEVQVEKELEVNVDCAQERLERLPQLDLGQFDFIECSGVRSDVDRSGREEIHLSLIHIRDG